jgi:hypothetical protein
MPAAVCTGTQLPDDQVPFTQSSAFAALMIALEHPESSIHAPAATFVEVAVAVCPWNR